jgi:hypothetical protein
MIKIDLLLSIGYTIIGGDWQRLTQQRPRVRALLGGMGVF